MHNGSDTSESFKERFKYILLVHRMRRPLLLCAMALVCIGQIEAMYGLDALLRPNPTGASMHPFTALSILWLGFDLVLYRPYQCRPSWRHGVSLGLCIALVMLLLTRAWLWISPSSAVPLLSMMFDGVGTDTAAILALLYLSSLLQRVNGRMALTMVLIALNLMTAAFVAMSYGQSLLEGQMSAATALAVIPLSLGLLTLFVHRTFARVLLLSGPVGLRTRMMIGAGIVVPWLAGWVLHHVVGVPDRAVPVEALLIATIIFSMAGVSMLSGYLHESVDRDRRRFARELRRMAVEDQLTGILNRNGIMAELGARWKRYRASGEGQAIVLFDLDHFKAINDSYGHAEGDRVLSGVAAQLRPHLRRGDVMGRWGGEEFLVLIDIRADDDVKAIVDRLCAALQSDIAQAKIVANAPERITGSFGVASFLPADVNETSVITRADEAMYRAKQDGRNRVRFDDQSLPQAA